MIPPVRVGDPMVLRLVLLMLTLQTFQRDFGIPELVALLALLALLVLLALSVLLVLPAFLSLLSKVDPA
jgi:hypothetical protein